MSMTSKLQEWQKEVKQLASGSERSVSAQSRRSVKSKAMRTIFHRAESIATMPPKEVRLNVPPLL